MYVVTRDYVRDIVLLWEQNPHDMGSVQRAACEAYHSEAGCDDYVTYTVVTLLADTDIEHRIEEIPHILRALDSRDASEVSVVAQLFKDLQVLNGSSARTD